MTTTLRQLEGLIKLRAVGTSEGAKKGWESRQRSGGDRSSEAHARIHGHLSQGVGELHKLGYHRQADKLQRVLDSSKKAGRFTDSHVRAIHDIADKTETRSFPHVNTQLNEGLEILDR